MKKLQRSYGWAPDVPDQRDYLYSAIRPVVRLPRKVDLCESCSAVENQSNLGSCTAQALAGNLEYLDKKIDSIYTDVSRLFIYLMKEFSKIQSIMIPVRLYAMGLKHRSIKICF